MKPDYPNIALAQARLWERQDKLSQAVEILEAVVQQPGLGPFFLQDSLFHLGRIAYNDNQTQKSIAALERLIELNPAHSNAHYTLGLAYERAGNIARARAEYERVLELNPGNVEVKERLEQL